jgi:hypothetical protein
VAELGVDNGIPGYVQAGLCGNFTDARDRTYQYWGDQSGFRRINGTLQRTLIAGMRHRGWCCWQRFTAFDQSLVFFVVVDHGAVPCPCFDVALQQ